MADKKIVYTDFDRAIVDALKGAEGPLTLAEIKEASGKPVTSGHMLSAVRKGLIKQAGDKEITRSSTRQVSAYHFVGETVVGVAKSGKPFELTENDSKILAVAKQFGDSAFTLAQLTEKAGFPIHSGSLNSLVRKGILSKAADKVDVEVETPATVKTYAYVADVPEAD